MTVRLASWGKRTSKYGNRRFKTAAGVSFDSVSEQRRWQELQLLEKAGEIRNLVLHPRFRLEVNSYHICDYVADFGYEVNAVIQLFDKKPAFIPRMWVPAVEDRKAGTVTQTDVFKLKRKLMKAIFDIDILITGKAT